MLNMYGEEQYTGPYTTQTSYSAYPTDPPVGYPRSHSPRTVKRINSNARKRLRQHIVNEAFLQLRDMVPTRRPEKKMSKLQILKSATKYIDFLTQILRQDQEAEKDRHEDNVPLVSSTTDFFDIVPPDNKLADDKKTFYFSDEDFY